MEKWIALVNGINQSKPVPSILTKSTLKKNTYAHQGFSFTCSNSVGPIGTTKPQSVEIRLSFTTVPLIRQTPEERATAAATRLDLRMKIRQTLFFECLVLLLRGKRKQACSEMPGTSVNRLEKKLTFWHRCKTMDRNQKIKRSALGLGLDHLLETRIEQRKCGSW